MDSIYDIVWARDPQSGAVVKYRDVRYQDELQMSVSNFEKADVEKTWKHFEMYESESQALINQFNALLADKNATGGCETAFPSAGRLRALPEVLASFQSARRSRGYLGDGARGSDCPHPAACVGLAKAYVAQQNVGAEAVKLQKGGAA